MKDIMTMLQDLRRPRLLIQAARIGAQNYQRDLHLARILGYGNAVSGTQAIIKLIERERDLDEKRRCDDAGYNIAQHVDVLSAMMGEARLLRAARTAKLQLV
ncbi:DUF6477 family protein [Primorskyibacter sp. S187A]|uniref:DUF6477 family protein n=1 Tax=Primorskyibacter sp. S187A TaxID=3415130 RepID=UPI003C79AC75